MSEYRSKTVTVNMPSVELFNRLTDIQGMLAAVPRDYRNSVQVSGDTVRLSYAGFNLAIRISEKSPFTRVAYSDVEAPFHFTAIVHLDPADVISRTTLWVELSADLNFMMKALIGNKIQEYLDKVVTAIGSGGVLR